MKEEKRKHPFETGTAHGKNPSEARELRRYSAPRLEILGDLRDLTLGPSSGTNDSGGQNGFTLP